jgi:hypothetical protein
MNIENLNLESFDINDFEPPNFNISGDFTPIENLNNDDYDEYENDSNDDYSSDEDEELEEGIDAETVDIDIDQENEEDFDENFDNVIFSYPFYSKNGVDYEYRVTISTDEILMEQVKCDDNKIDFDNSVEVFSEIFRGTLEEGFSLIVKNIDLRDKKSELREGIIDYNFEDFKGDVETLKSKIESNKVSVLFELYKEIIDSVYE